MSETPDLRLKTLQELCSARIKETFPLSAVSAKHLLDLCLPAPVVKVLAECLPPCELLALENATKDKSITEGGWEHQCKKRPHACKLHRSETHPAALSAFEEAASSHRDVWLQFYFSQYLWQHLHTWDPKHPETHARAFLFCARDQDTMEQFPPWTFEEFERHTVTVAELVKGVGIRPPAQNGYWPKIIQAFRVNLTALTVDMLRDKNFVAFLQVLQELMSRGCLRCLKLTNERLSLHNWHLLFFVCSGLFHCPRCAQPSPACMRDMPISAAGETGPDCSASLFAHVPSHVVDALKKVGYPGLADPDAGLDSLYAGAAVDLTNSADAAYDESLCKDEREDEEEDKVEDEEGDDSDASGSDFIDDDLLNEVSAGYGAPLDGSRKEMGGSCDCSGSDCVEGGVGGEACAGRDHASGTATSSDGYVTALRRWITETGERHISEDHVSCGIEAMSLQSAPDRRQTELAWLALACSLPSWSSLATLHIMLDSAGDLVKDVGKTLVKKMGRGDLKDLVLILQEDPPDHNSPHLEQFFREALQQLASRHKGSQNRPPPMQRLSIDGNGEEFSANSVHLPGEDCFHGLQLLKLNSILFDGPDTFSPLAQFIGRDQALRCLYLQNCSLDAHCTDLLFNALSSVGSQSLEVLDLQSSLDGMSKSQWSKLCHLLAKRPSLAFLSLKKCRITGSQVKSAEFIAAVQMHGTDRKLALDLSCNDIDDGLADFMSSAVCPGSSLKDLRIVGTWKTEEQGIAVADRIVVNCAPILPLLQHISVGVFCGVSLCRTKLLDEVRMKMQRIAKVVRIVDQNAMVEHIAMM